MYGVNLPNLATIYKVLPEAVYIPENDYEVVDHPKYEGEKQAKNLWTVDKSKLTVLLIKAVQSPNPPYKAHALPINVSTN